MAASAFIEVLILETDAGEMPAIRAISRTPLPAARNCFAFSTFGLAIGGRPNLIVRLRSRSLAAQEFYRAVIAAGGGPSSLIHRTATSRLSRPCRFPRRSKYTATPAARQVSMNVTRSAKDFPILSIDQTNTLSIAPDRIASTSASSPERRS